MTTQTAAILRAARSPPGLSPVVAALRRSPDDGPSFRAETANQPKTMNATYTVEEYVSGNQRNRCAGVFLGDECVASYHVADYGSSYRAQAEAHAARLNAERKA